MISLACEQADHAQCYRSTCDCHCGHPGRLTDDDRARLEARPVPTAIRTVPRASIDDPPKTTTPRRSRQPRAPRPRRICADCPDPVDRPGRAIRCTTCHATWLAAQRTGRPTLDLPMEEITAAYLAGAGSLELGDQHGCSHTTILQRLREAGVPIRTHHENRAGPRVVVPIDELVALYAAGHGTKRLAVQYGCSPGTITRRLQEAGVTIRRQGGRSIVLPVDELVAAYQAGQSCEDLGPIYCVTPSTIARRLRSAGVDVDPNAGRKVPDEVVAAFTREYLEGDSADTVAERHHLGATTVRAYLARAGVLRPVGSKPNGAPRRLDLPVDELVRRYRLGWSLLDLATEYGCSDKAIRDRIVAAGVEIRPACRHTREVA